MDVGGRVVLFVGRGHELEVDRGRFEVVECDVDPRRQYWRILWEQFALPKILDRHGCDVVHFPYSAYPALYGGKSIVTLNDSTRFLVPGGVPVAQRWYRAVVEEQIAAHRQHVIAVSHADAAVLREHLGLARGQVSVVYYGVAERFRVPAPVREKGNYVLWTGRPYPHKNLGVVLRAYQLLLKRKKDLPLLRLVGVEERYRAGVAEMVEATGTGRVVSVEGPVRHEALPELVRRAMLFVFPSAYESFGLPVLEAMASGTAVVCSDIPAFEELYGPATVQCPVSDPHAFAEAIGGLLADAGRRRELEARGMHRAERFTWEACARETAGVYRRVLG